MIDLESCPACGKSTSASTYHATYGAWPRHGGKDAPRWALAHSRCECSHIYANPQPTFTELVPFYGDDYHQFVASPRSDEQIRQDVNGAADGRFNRIRVVPGGRFLDIGCGIGDTVAHMAALGMQAQGLEVSEPGVLIGRKRGLEIFHGTLQQANYPDDTFDSVTLFHVLEHVQDAVDLLRTVARIMKPDGEFLLIVPNANSMMFALLKDLWMNVDVPRHIHHFTPASLRATAERAGLAIADITTESLPWMMEIELEYWLRHRYRVPIRLSKKTGYLKPLARRLAKQANASDKGEVIIAHMTRRA